MGHHTHFLYFEVDTFESALSLFRRKQEDDRHQYGAGSSADSVSSVGVPKYTGKTFKNREDAEEWIDMNLDKYDSVIAKIVYNSIRDLPEAKKTKIKESIEKSLSKTKAKLDKAKEIAVKCNELVSALENDLSEVAKANIENKLAGDSSHFLSCRHCKSKMNVSLLKKNGLLSACPVCLDVYPFSTAADYKKLSKAIEKSQNAKLEYTKIKEIYLKEGDEAQNAIAEKYGKVVVGWVIGCDVHA